MKFYKDKYNYESYCNKIKFYKLNAILILKMVKKDFIYMMKYFIKIFNLKKKMI